MFENDRCCIYLVDLKNIGSNTDTKKVVSLIKDFLNHKIPGTIELIDKLLREKLGIRNPNYFGVLVLPMDAINKLWENYASCADLARRLKEENSWLTYCDDEIRVKRFPQ